MGSRRQAYAESPQIRLAGQNTFTEQRVLPSGGMARIFLKSYTLLLVLYCAATPALFAEVTVGRNLGLLNPGKAVSLRLRDDQVIPEVELQSIDEKSLVYKKEAMSVKIDRELVYRARQGEAFYSDLPLSSEDHARFTTYLDYIHERGDIIVDTDEGQYIGNITGETDAVMTIRTRAATYDVEKRKVAAWRRAGVWYGDENARVEPSASAFALKPYTDRKKILNFSLMLTAPWAYLPQFGLGVNTNVNWPLWGGVRGTLGYITSGNSLGVMAQGAVFLNVNIVNLQTSRMYFGSNYLWRAAGIVDSRYARGAGYNGTVTAEIIASSYTLHLGLKYKNLLFEAGAEMPVTSRVTYDTGVYSTVTPELQRQIDQALGDLRSTVDTFQKISRVYFMAAWLF
jgi:hypothetical protein